MQDISKKDWKLFREKLPEWQERYMESLIIKYVRMLSSPGNASDHFWELEKWIRRDKKHPGVILELNKSEMPWDIALLIKKRVIKMDYLEGCLGAETEPYLELIEYYRDKDPDRAAAIAEFGLKKCKKDQTDIIIYLIQDAKQAGDDDRYSRFLKGAKMRRAVNFARVQEALDQC